MVEDPQETEPERFKQWVFIVGEQYLNFGRDTQHPNSGIKISRQVRFGRPISVSEKSRSVIFESTDQLFQFSRYIRALRLSQLLEVAFVRRSLVEFEFHCRSHLTARGRKETGWRSLLTNRCILRKSRMLELLDFLGHLGDRFEQIGDQPVVGDREYRRLLILVDRADDLR